MADIKLVYFGIRARAEPLRLSLAAAGKKYEDVCVDFGAWPGDEKAKTPYGSLPYLVYKGKTYGECKAIASFLARECGMAGKTSADAMRVDEVYSLAQTLIEERAKLVIFQPDEAKKSEGAKQMLEEVLPKFLGYFQRFLKENGDKGFVVGTGLSQADLTIYDITETQLKCDPKVLDAYPEIQKLRKNVEANANVKAYLAKRPDRDF